MSCRIAPLHVADYYRSHGARDVCHGVKAGDLLAVVLMAERMARLCNKLPTNSILIPIPSHTGQATATLALVKVLSALSGLPFVDIIQGHYREPLYSLKQKRRSIPPQFFGFRVTQLVSGAKPVLIDSVYDTGQTATAAAGLFIRQASIVVAFARVSSKYLCPPDPRSQPRSLRSNKGYCPNLTILD